MRTHRGQNFHQQNCKSFQSSATKYLSIIFIFLLLNILHLQAIRYPQMRLTKIPWGSQVIRKLRQPEATGRCITLDVFEWGEEVIASSCSMPRELVEWGREQHP